MLNKSRSFFLLLTGFFIASISFAQNADKTTRLLVLQDVVFPNKSAEYEKVQKATNEFLKKNKSGISWECYQTDDFTYMYVIPFSDLKMIDSMNKAWDAKMKSFNQDDFMGTVNGFIGCINHVNSLIVKLSPQSYMPKNPRLKTEEATFLHWDFFEIIPGKEREAWGLAADYKKLNTEKNIVTPYNLFSVEFGQNSSTIIMTTRAKNTIDFYTQNKVDDDNIGDSSKELDSKFWALIKKFSHFNGKFRADLSLTSAM